MHQQPHQSQHDRPLINKASRQTHLEVCAITHEHREQEQQGIGRLSCLWRCLHQHLLQTQPAVVLMRVLASPPPSNSTKHDRHPDRPSHQHSSKPNTLKFALSRTSIVSRSSREVVGCLACGSACSCAFVNSACAAAHAIHCTFALPVVTHDCKQVVSASNCLCVQGKLSLFFPF